MWDDDAGHHTVYSEVMGISTFTVYDGLGEKLLTVVPESKEQTGFCKELLDEGQCFICDDMEGFYSASKCDAA
jgi:hypothetical protein